jgi:hypothetical protein
MMVSNWKHPINIILEGAAFDWFDYSSTNPMLNIKIQIRGFFRLCIAGLPP